MSCNKEVQTYAVTDDCCDGGIVGSEGLCHLEVSWVEVLMFICKPIAFNNKIWCHPYLRAVREEVKA